MIRNFGQVSVLLFSLTTSSALAQTLGGRDALLGTPRKSASFTKSATRRTDDVVPSFSTRYQSRGNLRLSESMQKRHRNLGDIEWDARHNFARRLEETQPLVLPTDRATHRKPQRGTVTVLRGVAAQNPSLLLPWTPNRKP